MDVQKPVNVTSPLLPPLDELIVLLKDIWQRKWLTNNGHYHQLLEQALAEYLGVEYLSLFTNGTLPLITALQALHVSGEVITTPYSFVATTHALWWNGITPVFVDIDPVTLNLDAEQIEAAITDKTTAIMPVHVYGTPCHTDAIQQIANKYGLKIIYDAAHAFGVRMNGQSILHAGDMSSLSFHATKVFNTIEGGALICKNAETKRTIDQLKNFGFVNETTVEASGINGKMDEVRAAYGLINLQYVDHSISQRKYLANLYRECLADIRGIALLPEFPNVESNYSYFPIFVDEQTYGMSRDTLYEKLKDAGIMGRRYFYPLISEFPMYKDLPSSGKSNLPVAHRTADSVICLPMYGDLEPDSIKFIARQMSHK